MNFSEMSDYEINKAVAVANGYPEKDCDYGWSGKPSVGVEWNEETGYPTKSFDYCNSWADAGPILLSRKISLHAPSLLEAWSAEFVGSDEAVNDGYEVDYFQHRNVNPLRAAMIVFLMMQGATHD